MADLHVHPMLNAWLRRTPIAVRYPILATIAETEFNPTKVSWQRCHEAGVDLMCAAHFNLGDEWLSMPTDPNPRAPSSTMLMMDLLEQELAGPAAPYATLAKNHVQLADLLRVRKGDPDFRIAVVHTIEGGHALGGDLEVLGSLARRGAASMTITHFFNKGIATAANAYPFFPDGSSPWPAQGASAFGKEVVRRMEELGMIVDITHASATAVRDVLDCAHKPIVASHSAARTLADHAYGLYDDHMQEIAQRGGLIGVILDPYLLANYADVTLAKRHGSLRDAVRMVRYVAKICGSHRSVAIGSDYSGYIGRSAEMNRLSQIGRLRSRLLKEFGEDEQVVEDIMANNAIRFLRENWRTGFA
ncbi:hypothetical protein HN371_11690 [Candidatus Poribacteria bacterium]|nr:hypothetical protein [Candidatus Poribacteria bacterium]MBT5532191.1 hypothetical protein [Candidatus Poribacteria bacterium]MBT5712322.1 hypothetical protein [Candidatus Poribacteria bacterium]MBT7096282.1 hypothetical protein [Candidatus Poribacteria bacterium]MBT7805016.1 hypothetical protein [Candidatus Poribacteria bacterium]